MPTLVVSRTVTDVRFADQQTMMLVLPMMRGVRLSGNVVPQPGTPCDNIDKPALQPFDAGVAPPSTMMGITSAAAGRRRRSAGADADIVDGSSVNRRALDRGAHPGEPASPWSSQI